MSTQLPPEQRTIRARVAAYSKHAKHNPAIDCAKARDALWNKYRDQVDPDHALDEAERDRRARAAMHADLSRRALAAAKQRKQERERDADTRLADALIAGGAL